MAVAAAGSAVDGKGQEKGPNFGQVIAGEGLVGGLIPHSVAQEPGKRGRDDAIALEVDCLRKKRRSAADAISMVVDVISPASATPPPRIFEQESCENGDKKFSQQYRSSRRNSKIISTGEASDGKKKEKMRPCDLAAVATMGSLCFEFKGGRGKQGGVDLQGDGGSRSLIDAVIFW